MPRICLVLFSFSLFSWNKVKWSSAKVISFFSCYEAELDSKRIWLTHLNEQRDCSTTRPLNFACLWQTGGCYLWCSSLSQTCCWAAFFRNTYETFIAGCHDHNNMWQQQWVEIFMQTLVESENPLVVLKQLPLRSVNRGWGVTQDGDKVGGLEFGIKVQNVWAATTQEAGCFT